MGLEARFVVVVDEANRLFNARIYSSLFRSCGSRTREDLRLNSRSTKHYL